MQAIGVRWATSGRNGYAAALMPGRGVSIESRWWQVLFTVIVAAPLAVAAVALSWLDGVSGDAFVQVALVVMAVRFAVAGVVQRTIIRRRQ